MLSNNPTIKCLVTPNPFCDNNGGELRNVDLIKLSLKATILPPPI